MTSNTTIISHYKSLDAGSYIATKVLTFQELLKYFKHKKIDSENKYAAGLYLLAEMKESRRKDSNVLTRTAIVLDYDEIPNEFDLVKFFDENMATSYILHSTWSHTDENKRIRVILPLSEPLPAKYYSMAVGMYEKAIGILCDPASKTVSQAMSRRVLKSEDAPEIFEYKDTKFIDTEKLIAMIEKELSSDGDINFKVEYSNKRDGNWWSSLSYGVGNGQRNSSLASLTGLCLRKNMPLQAMYGLLWCWSQQCEPPIEEKEFQKTVESIIKKHIEGGGMIIDE
ncbi:primase alpha helix C-terminal domain-containing protein [Macrococcus sp. EM39E]|uniref:primase alpha helix C-terminal domain-containing protein n=1 Tax=Macrococcus animalis TaxID=3395467 RepID=UPI0039BEB267